ncbi:MAG: AmmeMemoRadiSam system protein A [Anaerolineae bacterium]|jgi:AmmeMemoRadiSam system protein A
MSEHHPLVELARQAIEAYVRTGKVIDPPEPLTPEMQEQAGTFVSLHDRRGQLRGCIGTFVPTRRNVALEIIHNAISAATRDPRFPPVVPAELEGLNVKVDVLSEPEAVAGPEELDAERYGVIVQAKEGWHRRGLLLPDLEGVDSVEEQIRICRLKAGIGPAEPVELSRFEVRRYT